MFCENTTTYVYYSLYQLVRENNQKAGKSWTYTYDSAGNILSKKEYAYSTGSLGSVVDTITYTYGNFNWGDQLTSYDGTAITYDAIGNPLNWTDGRTFTWSGRQLSSITDSDGTITYTYNADGIRTKKQWVYDDEATETVEYILDDNNTLLGEIYTYTEADGYIETESIYYFYDESGSPVYCTYNGSTYYYVKNQQGDITGLMKSDGTMSVTYEYDAWGNLISSSRNGSDAYGLYTLNVYTYRGYIYDIDTGFYYLQSRYYDPEVGRFLNVDNTNYLGSNGTALGYNLYTYCENNVINFIDTNENFKIPYLIRLRNYNHNKSLQYPTFIYNQHTGSAAITKMGYFSGDYNGCGWIAIYNAYAVMGLSRFKHPSTIINDLESHGMYLGGALGVLPKSIANYFKRNYYTVDIYSSDKHKSSIDNKIKNCDVAILCYSFGVRSHYITITWDGLYFELYNSSFSSTSAYYVESAYISLFKSGRNWGFVSLICIS